MSASCALRRQAAPLREQAARYAVKEWMPSGAGLHRGIVQIGKLSPRTESLYPSKPGFVKATAQAQCSGARLRLVLRIGFAAIYSGSGRPLWPRDIHFEPGVRFRTKRAGPSAKRKQLPRRSTVAWTGKESSPARPGPRQILVALRESDPDYSPDRRQTIEQYFRSMADPSAPAGAVSPGQASESLGSHRGAWTFAQYGIPAYKIELEFLLSAQGADGGWPLFGGPRRKSFTSSYGTAAAILALHGQPVCNPIADRGSGSPPRWTAELTGSERAGRGARAGGITRVAGSPGRLPGLSGFALFALQSRGRVCSARSTATGCASSGAAPPRCAASVAKAVQVGNRSFPERRATRAPLDDTRDRGGLPEAGIFRKVPRGAVARARPCARGFDLRDHRNERAAIVAEALLALRSEAKHE